MGTVLDQPLRRIPSFGRRIGKGLRDAQKQLISGLLPTLSLQLPEANATLDLATLFPHSTRYWLEIGFGGGEHLAEQCRQNPSTGFIGCEPYINGIVSLLKAVDGKDTSNLRIWQDDARLVLDRLPTGTIDRVFILFPDPWPKKRHYKRRIISDAMLDLLADKIRPGGELRIATDHQDYLRWILSHCLRHDAFNWTAFDEDDWKKPPADWVQTRYQQKAEEQGIPCFFLRFIRL